MKRKWSTILLVIVFLTGLSLLLYPTLSDYWNSFHQSRAIAEYAENVAAIDNGVYDAIWEKADAYNAALAAKDLHLELSEEEEAEYNETLSLGESGIMSYIEIPKIKCSLPIYHGTSEEVLQIAVGHLEGTSLPVGGENTHCVLSGHRGLPSARLFTDIDQLVVGDEFMIRTLDETLTYEVDLITIVLPHEVDGLRVFEGQDYCTLVTCTPYGINTHRLLVRGHRIETQKLSQIRVTADAMQIEPVVVAPLVAVPMLLLLLIWMLISTGHKKKR